MFDDGEGSNKMDPLLEEFADLSDDPELAFIQYESKLRKRLGDLRSHEDRAYDETSGRIDERLESQIADDKMRYYNSVFSFTKTHKMDVHFPEISRLAQSFSSDFDLFKDEVDKHIVALSVIQTERKRIIKTNFAIPKEIKSDIHKNISAIRELLNGIDIGDDKKDVLFVKLNAFSEELDRDITKTEAWTSFILGAANTANTVGNKLVPIKKAIDSINGLLGKAQDITEQLKLPSPHKKLPSPPKQIEGPKTSSQEMDDENPF